MTAITIGLSMCLLVIVSFLFGNKLATRHAPMIDAVMEIKLETATAHLWFMESLSHGNSEDMDKVLTHLEQAESYARSIVDADINNQEGFNPLRNQGISQEIIHIQEHLNEFKQITEQYLGAQIKPDRAIDQRYNASYTEFVTHADELKNRLMTLIQNELYQFEMIQQGLVILIILATVTGLAMIVRNQRWWQTHTDELNRLQQVARESERKLSTLIDNLRGMVYRCRKDEYWTMKFVSDGCEALTGYTPDELINNSAISYADLIVPDDRKSVEDGINRSTSENKPFELTYRIRRKDGEIRWVWEKGRQIPESSDSPDILEGFISDITQITKAKEQLSRAEAEWTQAMDQFDDIVYLLDMNRHLLRANNAFYRTLNATPDECLGRHIVDLIHPFGEDESCVVCQIQEARSESVITMEADDINNPTNKPLEITLKLVNDNGGNATGMIVNLHDLSNTREIEERLRLSASVFENSVEGVVITNPEGNIIEVNRAFCDILGYPKDEVIGQNPKLFKSGRHDKDFYRSMWKSLNTAGQWRGEIWNRRKNGSIFPEWLTINSVHDESNKLTHYIGIFSDITHIKRSQEQIDHLSHHDPLTDLPNRLLLQERLEQAIKLANRHDNKLAVVFIDVDRFKQINDSFGHPIGDQLLQNISSRLLGRLSEGDTLARISGDVFVLLLEDVDNAEKTGVAVNNILSAFNDPFQLGSNQISITASVGIALFPGDATDATTLMRNADAALHRAKEAGHNQYQFYTEELTQNAFKRVSLENSLRQAIQQNEFFLVYQPQVEAESERVIGAETLIRWHHPELGPISPAQFIPLAEETGMILEIGNWVLTEACRQGEKWLQQGLDFGRLAINIAGPQIQHGKLADEVSDVLANSGFPPAMLELEVTEGFIMQEAEVAIEQLNLLRDLGITLSIDDFGTGYSSLSYLKRLPIHTLKIDQSFVQDIPENSEDVAITCAIIALGNSLDMSIIAEGVESAEQSQFLKEHGCKLAQGFFYSEPLTASEFEEFLRSHNQK